MLALMFLMTQVWATTTADIEVLIKGMVCSFCVQGIEKKFNGEESVEKVKVELEKSTVFLWIVDEKELTDATITSLVQSAGYNVENIQRNENPKSND